MKTQQVNTNHRVICNPNELVDNLLAFTKKYREIKDNIELREAECYKIQWKSMICNIADDDLFVGLTEQPAIGFLPQSDEGSMGYYIHPIELQKLANDKFLSTDRKKIISELIEYWDKNNTVQLAKNAYDTEMSTALKSDLYYAEPGIAFTLWRMSGVQLDYEKLVRLGIPGLRAEITNYQKQVSKDSEEYSLYKAMLMALDTFADVCEFYCTQIDALLETETDAVRKSDLHIMKEVLLKLPENKPETLREAIQLIFLYNALDSARNYGRLDEALATVYEVDIKNNQISEVEAIRLMSSFWRLISKRNYRYDSRIIIGGKGRTNEKYADKIALLMIETTRQVKDIVPQLALRFYKDQNPELYQNGLNVIGEGNPFPMLYNDEVNIPSAMKAFNIPYKEAVHIIQYGCGEYVLNHRSVGTPSAVISLLQALIVTLHKGIEPISGKQMGMPEDRYDKYGNFETYDQLWNAYCEQVEYHVAILARHEALEYDFAGKGAPYLYSSMLMDDCIKRGKGIYSGGIRYLGGTLEVYGNSNTADSFTAIKKLVYDEHKISLDQLIKAMDSNFEGNELLRKMLLDCPKYGNDNTLADDNLVKIHEHICNYTQNQAKKTTMHSYLVVVINNDANTLMGAHTAASPDGRKAKTYMNPGNAPVGGADKNGVTAFFNSILKPQTNIHAGAVQNMKFSKELFTEYRDKLEILMQTYWQNGGAQAMFTVVGRDDLQQALLFPERYQSLIVRVGGFSERFVNLPRHTQDEILSRTLY
jgi:pyruvate-formate lyase